MYSDFTGGRRAVVPYEQAGLTTGTRFWDRSRVDLGLSLSSELLSFFDLGSSNPLLFTAVMTFTD